MTKEFIKVDDAAKILRKAFSIVTEVVDPNSSVAEEAFKQILAYLLEKEG